MIHGCPAKPERTEVHVSEFKGAVVKPDSDPGHPANGVDHVGSSRIREPTTTSKTWYMKAYKIREYTVWTLSQDQQQSHDKVIC